MNPISTKRHPSGLLAREGGQSQSVIARSMADVTRQCSVLCIAAHSYARSVANPEVFIDGFMENSPTYPLADCELSQRTYI